MICTSFAGSQISQIHNMVIGTVCITLHSIATIVLPKAVGTAEHGSLLHRKFDLVAFSKSAYIMR